VTGEPTTGTWANRGTEGLPVFNPFLPGFAENPYEQYRELLARNPVQPSPFGAYMLFRYEDCARVLRDPKLSVEDRRVIGPNPRAELRERVLGDRERRGTRGMLNLDPPDHTRVRGIVQKVFTPRAVERLGVRVQALVDETLVELAARDQPVDLVAELAFPLPFQVISDMLGMPPGDRTELRSWAHTLTLGLEPTLAGSHFEEIVEASDLMHEHVLDAIAWKRANPADDLLTALIAAEEDGARLTTDELVDQVVLLFVAGHETTVNLLGNGTLALLRNRAQLERWRRDPSRSTNAVEELLRFDPPVQLSRRVTTSNVELDDRVIAKGTLLLVFIGAANHDPARWGDDADALDLGRPGAAQHLSFGSGIHHCLGAALARLEGRIALSSLVTRFPGIELAGDGARWSGRLTLRGLDELWVRLGADAGGE
jgi:cytochrome P450